MRHRPVPEHSGHLGSGEFRCVFWPVPKHERQFPLPRGSQWRHFFDVSTLEPSPIFLRNPMGIVRAGDCPLAGNELVQITQMPGRVTARGVHLAVSSFHRGDLCDCTFELRSCPFRLVLPSRSCRRMPLPSLRTALSPVGQLLRPPDIRP